MSRYDSRTTVVDVTYTDPKTGQRFRERRIQDLADDEVEDVRRRELAMVLPPSRDELELYYPRERERENDDGYDRRGRRNEDFLAVAPYRPERARSYRGGRRRRSPSSESSSQSSSDSEDDRRRRRRGDRRRARSARPDVDRSAGGGAGEEDEAGILWYSGKPRKDCNFLERHFDSSYDGLISAAAGAAIGAMTARRFAHTEGEDKRNRNLKTWGGAVVGAGLFNVVENHYRVFTEEKIERAEEKIEEKAEKVKRKVRGD